jgi:hypothetical protein
MQTRWTRPAGAKSAPWAAPRGVGASFRYDILAVIVTVNYSYGYSFRQDAFLSDGLQSLKSLFFFGFFRVSDFGIGGASRSCRTRRFFA